MLILAGYAGYEGYIYRYARKNGRFTTNYRDTVCQKKVYGGEHNLHNLHNLQRGVPVIYSLHALILRNGNVMRSDIARPETVARHLSTVQNLADYQVWFWWRRESHRMTAEGFLALYEAGRIPTPKPLREMEVEAWT